jgi:formamidopyrimidine-DNA glycosylase
MPELPEVETVRLGLAPVMEGAVIDRVEVRRPDLRSPFPARFAKRLTGRKVVGRPSREVSLADLDDGNGPGTRHVWPFRIEAAGEAGSPAFHLSRSDRRAHDHVVPTSRREPMPFNDPRCLA